MKPVNLICFIEFCRIPLPLKNKGYKFGNTILNESPESSPPPPPAPSQPPLQSASQSGVPGSGNLSNSMIGLVQGGGGGVGGNNTDLNVAYTDGTSQYNRSGSVGSDLYGTSPAYSSAYLASRYGTTTTDHSSAVPRYASAYLNYGTLQPQHMMLASATSAPPHSQAPPVTQSTNLDHSSYYPQSHNTRYTDYLRQHQAPPAVYGVSEATSPRWRRQSYDYDTNTMLGNVGGDYRRSMHGGLSATMVGSARSRSRSRGGNFASVSEFDSVASPYLRYTSPATATMNDANSYNMSSAVSSATGLSSASNPTRPMSGYIYGHSYGYHGHVGSGIGSDGSGIGSGMGIASGASIVPHPPPGYNAKGREVSARIRRYQQPES